MKYKFLTLLLLVSFLNIKTFCQNTNIQPFKILPGHEFKVMGLCFSSDGKYLASGGWDNKVRLWDITNFSQIREFESHTDVIWQVEISRDNKYIISGSRDVSYILWNLRSGEIINKTINLPQKISVYPDYPEFKQIGPNSVNSICFSNDTKLIAIGSSERLIHIYDTDSFKLRHTLKGHNALVLKIAFSSNNEFMVSGAFGKEIIIWDTKTFQPIKILKEEKGYNGSFQLINNDKYLANTGNCRINIWDFSSDTIIRSIPVQCYLQSVSVTADEKFMATCGEDHTARLYNFKTGEEIWCYTNPKPEVADCKFSPDGKLLAVATPEGKILIWKVDDLINNTN